LTPRIVLDPMLFALVMGLLGRARGCVRGIGGLGQGRGWLPRQCGDLCALWRVRCQHPVVAVAMQARGRDQRGQPLDQFRGREAQLGAPIRLGLGGAIDELVVAELLEALQRKRRARAVAQQALQPGAVGALDAHRGIQRKRSSSGSRCAQRIRPELERRFSAG
jgi:hypothetical protein